MFSRLTATGLLAAACLTTSANAAVYSFFDTTFANVDWIGLKHADTTPGTAATFTSFQQTPGGSPLAPFTPDYRETSHTYDNGAIIVSHRDTTFNWTPLPLETATTVDYQYDLSYLQGPTGAVGYSPAIFQAGNVYRITYDNIFIREWSRFTGTALPLSAFELLSPVTGNVLPGNNPNGNLSMSFGFVSANSAGGGGPFTKLSGLDNYGLRLNTVIAPEPGSITLVLGGACALLRRRRA